MWYFSWLLGVGLACAFSILNGMWLELREYDDKNGTARGRYKKMNAEERKPV